LLRIYSNRLYSRSARDSRIVSDEIIMMGRMVLSDDYRLTDNESSTFIRKSVFESSET
jgi:hypothetical protein